MDSTSIDTAAESGARDPSAGSQVDDGVVEHPSAEDFGQARSLPADRTWFKRAVFYEVLVRAFYDATADGSGDLRGLTEKLAWRRLSVASPVLRLAAARRRLRHPRLLQGAAGVRHGG
jgi:hypothetical protein